MPHIEDYSADQLRALAAKKEREAAPDVVDIATGRPLATGGPAAWPTETTLEGTTFHIVPGLSDDWEFQEMLSEFAALAEANDLRANEVAKRIIRYVYVEPYDEIVGELRALHPEDERPHVHVEDMAALVRGAVPKALGD